MAAQPRPRRPKRAVHGVLLLDKPLGLSSNDALQRAKRLYGAEKAGHTGTLDPLATGLLPLCFGAATKFAQISLDADKRYLATLQLGITTTTDDGEGEPVERRPVTVGRAEIEAVCRGMLGATQQIPPMHSALKVDGRPLYDYARAGLTLERAPRDVVLHAIDVVPDMPPGCEAEPAGIALLPNGTHDRWTIDVRCSKGTYIRTLAADIGTALGCGAHLAALRRTGSGLLTLDGAVTFDALDDMDADARDTALRPADALVAEWPAVRLNADDAGRLLSGMRRRLGLPSAASVRIYGPEARAFLGTGHIAGGELIPTRLLSPAEVQGLLNPVPMPSPVSTQTPMPPPALPAAAAPAAITPFENLPTATA